MQFPHLYRSVTITIPLLAILAPASAQKYVPPKPAAPVQASPVRTVPSAKPPPEVQKAEKLFQQALDAQRAQKLPEAVRLYKEVIKLTPGVYPAYFNLGLISEVLGQSKESEAAFRMAAKLEPK